MTLPILSVMIRLGANISEKQAADLSYDYEKDGRIFARTRGGVCFRHDR